MDSRLERVDASGPGVECHQGVEGASHVKGIMHTICMHIKHGCFYTIAADFLLLVDQFAYSKWMIPCC